MKVKWILSVLLCVLAPLTYAAEGETNSKHDGIEITVNVNTASAEELATLLKGIGLKKAHDIVEYRQENGPFKTAADLSNVKGIGAATVEKNLQRILL
ncbi:ComEA family DNA-binding protein [Vibrio rotiferianus]|uniref:ComEA family DNA-binding protein n=1 Tax=Vibrio rotiferianus TaxID=190895 RepID=UPI00406A370D